MARHTDNALTAYISGNRISCRTVLCTSFSLSRCRIPYGEAGFSQTIDEVSQLGNSFVSPAMDLAWALGNKAALVPMNGNLVKMSENGKRLLLDRTYGDYSVHFRKDWMSEIVKLYRCHHVVHAPGNRFEYWWNPPSGATCADKSK